MYQFSIPNMTCGHCASAVTKAVKDVDKAAQVEVSLRDKRVTVKSSSAQDEIAEALKEAGYPARPA